MSLSIQRKPSRAIAAKGTPVARPWQANGVALRWRAMPDIKPAGRYTAAAAPPWAFDLVAALKQHAVKHIVTVPDSVIGPILAIAAEDPELRLTSVHREEEAVGVLAGLFLGGQRGAMAIQSSGLGNCLNALGSLSMVGRLPFPLIVGLRGEL